MSSVLGLAEPDLHTIKGLGSLLVCFVVVVAVVVNLSISYLQ